MAQPWVDTPVKHQPPALRGQKTLRRAEPWSAFHNDDIEELNAIDDTSVNEFYAVTADRDNRVPPTIVQPAWDDSHRLGRPNYKPGGIEALMAYEYREARKPPSQDHDGRHHRLHRPLGAAGGIEEALALW